MISYPIVTNSLTATARLFERGWLLLTPGQDKAAPVQQVTVAPALGR